MPTLLKILFAALLLVLLVALGAEVVALHRPRAGRAAPAVPVVVRKSRHPGPAAKTVRQLAPPASRPHATAVTACGCQVVVTK